MADNTDWWNKANEVEATPDPEGRDWWNETAQPMLDDTGTDWWGMVAQSTDAGELLPGVDYDKYLVDTAYADDLSSAPDAHPVPITDPEMLREMGEWVEDDEYAEAQKANEDFYSMLRAEAMAHESVPLTGRGGVDRYLTGLDKMRKNGDLGMVAVTVLDKMPLFIKKGAYQLSQWRDLAALDMFMNTFDGSDTSVDDYSKAVQHMMEWESQVRPWKREGIGSLSFVGASTELGKFALELWAGSKLTSRLISPALPKPLTATAKVVPGSIMEGMAHGLGFGLAMEGLDSKIVDGDTQHLRNITNTMALLGLTYGAGRGLVQLKNYARMRWGKQLGRGTLTQRGLAEEAELVVEGGKTPTDIIRVAYSPQRGPVRLRATTSEVVPAYPASHYAAGTAEHISTTVRVSDLVKPASGKVRKAGSLFEQVVSEQVAMPRDWRGVFGKKALKTLKPTKGAAQAPPTPGVMRMVQDENASKHMSSIVTSTPTPAQVHAWDSVIADGHVPIDVLLPEMLMGTTDLTHTPANLVTRFLTGARDMIGDCLHPHARNMLRNSRDGQELLNIMDKAYFYSESKYGAYLNKMIPLKKMLTRKEQAVLRRMVEGKEIIKSAEARDFVKHTVESLRAVNETMKGKVKGYREVTEHYFPRVTKPEVIEQILLGKGDAYAKLTKKYGKKTMEGLRTSTSKRGVRRVSNIDFARKLEDMPEEFLLDPIKSLEQYFSDAFAREAWAVAEGAGLGWSTQLNKLPKIQKIFQNILRHDGQTKARIAERVFMRTTGTFEPDPMLMGLEKSPGRVMRTYGILTKLPFAAHLNVIQPITTTATTYGLDNQAYGYWKSFQHAFRELKGQRIISDEGTNIAYDSGAMYRGIFMDMIDYTNLSNVQSKVVHGYLNATMFSPIEWVNQMADCHAALRATRGWAHLLSMPNTKFNKVKNIMRHFTGRDKRAISESLKLLGLNPGDIMSVRLSGKLTDTMQKKVVHQSVINHHFTHPSALNIPGFALDARTLFQFKRFAYQMGAHSYHVVKNAVPMPIKKANGKLNWKHWEGGNIRAFATHFGLGGVAVDNIRRMRMWMVGRSIQNENWSDRITNDFFYLGSLGWMAQATESGYKGGTKGAMDWMLGPSISDLSDLVAMGLGIDEYQGLPLKGKVDRWASANWPMYRVTGEGSWRLLNGLTWFNDYEKARGNVSHMKRSLYTRLGYMGDIPTITSAGTPTWYAKRIKKEFYDKNNPEAYGYMADHLIANMSGIRGKTLGEAAESLGDAIFGSNIVDSMPRTYTDKDNNTWDLKEKLWEDATESQRTEISTYVKLHEDMMESARFSVHTLVDRLVKQGLRKDKVYNADAVWDALGDVSLMQSEQDFKYKYFPPDRFSPELYQDLGK